MQFFIDQEPLSTNIGFLALCPGLPISDPSECPSCPSYAYCFQGSCCTLDGNFIDLIKNFILIQS